MLLAHLPFLKILKIFGAVLFYKWKKILVIKDKCPYYKLKDFSAKNQSLFYEMTNNNHKNINIKIALIFICLILNIGIIIWKKESSWSIIFVLIIYLFCGAFFVILQIEPWFFYAWPLNKCLNNDYFYTDSEAFSGNNTIKKCNKIVTILYFIIFLLWILTGLD